MEAGGGGLESCGTFYDGRSDSASLCGYKQVEKVEMAVSIPNFLAHKLTSLHRLISERAPNGDYLTAATGGATVEGPVPETRRDFSRLEGTILARRARTSNPVISN
jgi:hypothetical protein